jgi:hypothetical protein
MPSLVWRNWHETVSQPVQRFEVLRNPDESQSTVEGYNATTRLIQHLIGEAAGKSMSVRAVGGAWSFTTIAATDGILIATQRLNYRFALGAEQLQRAYSADRSPVFVQAGISIADLNKYLARRGQAVPTSGASNGQTIAGALSTGTHGAAIDFGAVPEYVVAIHLATSDGKTVWLERASYPVVKDSVIARFNADPVRNDELFNAALVSFGCFGIILGVVIEPIPLYYLHGWRQPFQFDDALWDAVQQMDFSAFNLPGASGRRPYHLELFNNVNDNTTVLTAMYKEDRRPPGSGSVSPEGGVGKGDSALDVIGAVTELWDGVTPIIAKVLTKGYGSYQNVAGTPGEVFKDTSTRGRSRSSAVGVPLKNARQAFTIASDAVRQAVAPALVSMRFVKSTNAMLGFTGHDAVTAIVEVDGAYSNKTLEAQQATWQGLHDANIAHSFHWGKLNDLDAGKVRLSYTDAKVQRWMDARGQLLTTPELRRVFANSFSDRLDISR